MRSAKYILGLLSLLIASAILLLSCSANRESLGGDSANNTRGGNSNSNQFDVDELARMKALWESRQILNYRMIVQARNFSNSARSVAIEVRDGKAESISKIDSTDNGAVEKYKRYDTVAKIFDVIETTSRSKCDELTVSYDPLLGYPTQVKADIDRKVADDEFSVMIVGLFSK